MDTNSMHWVISFATNGPIEVHATPQPGSKHKGTVSMEFPFIKEHQHADWDSGLYLSQEKGVRINMIRTIYALGLMNYIRDANGNKATLKKIFQEFGRMFHADFSRYNNDLTRTMEDNTSIEKQTEVFRMMIEAFQKRILS